MAQILLFANNKLMFASCCWFTMKWQMLFVDTLSPCVLVFGASRSGKASAERPGREVGEVFWADGFVIPIVSPSVIVW